MGGGEVKCGEGPGEGAREGERLGREVVGGEGSLAIGSVCLDVWVMRVGGRGRGLNYAI